MAGPISTAIVDIALAELVKLGFNIFDLVARKAAGETVTIEQITSIQDQTKKVMDEAHARVERDKAAGL